MAEIKVEKKRSNVMPWIIGLILLGLLLWGVSRMGSRDQTDTTTSTRTGALAPNAPSTPMADQQQITFLDGVHAA